MKSLAPFGDGPLMSGVHHHDGLTLAESPSVRIKVPWGCDDGIGLTIFHPQLGVEPNPPMFIHLFIGFGTTINHKPSILGEKNPIFGNTAVTLLQF